MKLDASFFNRDVLEVAPDLLGCTLVRDFGNGNIQRFTITELEAYRGEEDLACHASKGRTPRTEIMYHTGGYIYVYLIYGMYWMLNLVTGSNDEPQAVLIRGINDIKGPGKVGRLLELDKSFYGENLFTSNRIWIEAISKPIFDYQTSPRIGIDYASDEWRLKPWRYFI